MVHLYIVSTHATRYISWLLHVWILNCLLEWFFNIFDVKEADRQTNWWYRSYILRRCTHSQCMPCMHLHDLWTNMCGLVSRHDTCFSVMHVHSLVSRLVRGWGMRKPGNEASMCNALSSLPFSHQAPSFPLLPSQFLPFWQQDNETASAATALRMIYLRKCT